MEALIGRMEALLTRLEGVLSAPSLGVNVAGPSGASVYHVASKEQMEADQKAIQEFIHRERHETGERPPLAD